MTEAWIWPAGLGLLGLVLGSFIATLVIRWPEGRSVSKGRSECDSCGKKLVPVELVPVLSYMLQRGRCRGCGGLVAPSHLVIELLGCAVGVMAGWAAPGIAGAFGAVLGWMLLALAALDYAAFWLPNALTLALALGGLAQGLLTRAPPPLDERLIGGVAGFAVLWLVAMAYRAVRGRHGLGGGDPKMLGALGLWFGWMTLPFLVLFACFYGLIGVAAIGLARRGVSGATKLPFGVLLALGAWTCWMMNQVPAQIVTVSVPLPPE
ncbi:MAG: prepilin peptidase [Sphingomonas sp.]|uniref:prepilin peptidase n=1 Tax=Sphingomonas sp. TaxID=28214 RepID=UPI0025CF9716|nr:A24 family peptidase [Sphingomonas sp.]MBX3564352.1 prepilin peptidase [Sphingomonas sp.]